MCNSSERGEISLDDESIRHYRANSVAAVAYEIVLRERNALDGCRRKAMHVCTSVFASFAKALGVAESESSHTSSVNCGLRNLVWDRDGVPSGNHIRTTQYNKPLRTRCPN